MNSNESNRTDDPLDRALEEWTVDVALPPRFQNEVWRRIELAKARRVTAWWGNLFQAVEAAMHRPALAVSYVVVLVLAGLIIGLASARQESARMDAALGERYVQSVDPYQAPRH